MQRIDINTALRRALTDKRTKQIVMDAVGWKDSDVSRVLADSQGIPMAKLDDLLNTIGYVPVERDYLHAVQKLCVVGSQCECALEGKGACGIQRRG